MSARVAIAQPYFPAYARLPRKVQRKADEFIRKFQHDPKQASIHYEPIGNVVDKQLRSVRVGDDYRAIVRAPETGNLFILLYVDHHDEAYRWAEGKQLAVHPATGTLQFFDVDLASAAVTSIAPTRPVEGGLDEADYEERKLFSDFTDQQLFVGGVPKMLLPAVRALYTEGDLDKLVEHLPREAADLLTGLAAGYDYDAVLESILEAAEPAPPSTRTLEPEPPREVTRKAEQDEAIEASLHKESTQAQFRLVDAEFDLDKALAHPLDAWRVYLHPSQKKIVRARTKGPLRVTGGAGTGKTVVAMHRAAFLVREVFTGPDDKILVTTFTKNLAHDIRSNLSKLLEPEELTRVEVINIDGWAFDYLRSQGRSVRFATNSLRDSAWSSAYDLYGLEGYDLSFCRAEWEAVIQAQGIEDENSYVRAVRHHRGVALARAERRRLWDVFREYRNGLDESHASEAIDILRAARKSLEQSGASPRYRAVIVDETQDLTIEALRLIRAIAGPERANDLLLVGDSHQRIYGRAAPLSQAGINIRGRRSRELRLNYRTTAAICRWSLRTLGTGEFDDLDGGRSSTKGYVSLRQGAAPDVRHFDSRADEQAFVVDEVKRLLAGGSLPEEICITAREKKLLVGIYGSALTKAGIEHELLEKDTPRRACVRLASMHRVKGLEFPVVFVVGVNDGIVPFSTPELNSEDPLIARQAEQQERCLLYVATSRARDRLYVTSYELKSPFLEGLEVPVQQEALSALDEPRASPRLTDIPISSTPTEVGDPPVRSGQGAKSILGWPLPTRMKNWLAQHDITTVAGLVSLDPEDLKQQRNLGRKSIRDTRQLIESRLGRKWEELRGDDDPRALRDELGEDVADFTEFIEQPIEGLPLPTRLFTWADQRGVTTLREVLAWHPLMLTNESGVGRGTVSVVRSYVEDRLGRRWEEIHRLIASGALEPEQLAWDDWADRLSPEILSHGLGEVALPARMRNFAEHEGLTTISDLVARKRASLLEHGNLGRASVRGSFDAIVRYSEEIGDRARKWGSGLLSALKDIFGDLDTIPRMIISRRAGLGTPPETLEEIGSTLGVTRERVRQVEKKTWDNVCRSEAFVSFVRAKCEATAPSGAIDLEALEGNSWWAGLDDEPDALDYFCDRLLDGRWRVVRIEGARYLAKIAQKDLDAARSDARKRAKGLSYPLGYDIARAEILRGCESLSPGVVGMVWEEIEEQLSFDGDGDQRRALAFGTTKYAQIVAYLEKCDEPVPIAEVFAATGRVGNFPEEVFMLARGVVGLERHFPNFREWTAKLVPLVVGLIEENGPERQWSCKDLIPSIREEIELPEWLEHWHLAAILRRSEGIEYLGRLRVALPGVIEDSARILIHKALESLLTAESEPLDWDEITRRLRQKLDVSDIALVGTLNRPPFIKVAKRSYGLLNRDLPGGIEAMSEALDELESIMERRGRGLAALFVRDAVVELSAIHATWTQEMCMSVVRADPRFRISPGGGAAGLASWESTRVPSRADLIGQAIEKSGGRVTVSAIQSRIEALYGEAPSRLHIGQVANRFGARLAGDWVEVQGG